jgi:hypothetical protein
MENFID